MTGQNSHPSVPIYLQNNFSAGENLFLLLWTASRHFIDLSTK
jgi:hypothetical protein